ncbi:MAG: hypothetical protein KAH18_09945 [Psychromonas sp.]|nr:hypothetical protein [Psychromonas sp.]
MKKSMKAVLLSVFVYPGMGHFVLKKYVMSAVLFTAFTIPLCIIVSVIFQKTEKIVAQIQNGEIPLNISTISSSLSSSSLMGELNIMTNVLLIVWIIGIIDSYRVGRSEV